MSSISNSHNGFPENSFSPAGAFLLRPMVQEIVQRITTECAEKKGRRSPLVLIDVERGHTINADTGAVRRILDLLIREAVDASIDSTESGSTPSLREVVITSVRTDRSVEIEIADSGERHSENVGLPTTAAESLVGRLGGNMRVYCCPEGGTAVTFSLPRQREASGDLRRAA